MDLVNWRFLDPMLAGSKGKIVMWIFWLNLTDPLVWNL
jgi:hypothetical protein